MEILCMASAQNLALGPFLLPRDERDSPGLRTCCNARLAFVLWASLGEERAASCGLESGGQSLQAGLARSRRYAPCPQKVGPCSNSEEYNARTEQTRDRGASVPTLGKSRLPQRSGR